MNTTTHIEPFPILLQSRWKAKLAASALLGVGVLSSTWVALESQKLASQDVVLSDRFKVAQSLRAEIEQLRATTDARRRELTDLREGVAQAQQLLSQTDAQRVAAETRRKQEDAQTASVAAARAELGSNIERDRKRLDDMHANLAAARIQIDILRAEAGSFQRDLELKRRESVQLETNRDVLLVAVRDHRAALAAVRPELANLQGQRAALGAEVDRASKQAQQLREQAQLEQERTSQARQEVATARGDMERMRRDAMELRREVAELQRDRPSLQAQVQSLQQQLESLTAGVHQRTELTVLQDRRLAEASARVAALDARRAGLEQRSADLEEQIREYQKRAATARAEVDRSVAEAGRAADLPAQLQLQRKELIQLKTQRDELEREVAGAERRAAEKRREFVAIVEDLAKLDRRREELSAITPRRNVFPDTTGPAVLTRTTP